MKQLNLLKFRFYSTRILCLMLYLYSIMTIGLVMSSFAFINVYIFGKRVNKIERKIIFFDTMLKEKAHDEKKDFEGVHM